MKKKQYKLICFIISNILPKTEKNPESYLTDYRRIEEQTGLTFFTYTNNNRLEQAANEMNW